MKRVGIAAFLSAAFFLCAHRPASAMVEFCPATLDYQRVGNDLQLVREQPAVHDLGAASTETASLYGLQLGALGPRTVTSAKLAFDTSAGWYTLDAPAMALAEKDRHYSAPWVSFVRRDYVSPVFYVRFPQALTVRHAWIYEIAAQGDDYGWQQQGIVQCDPYATASQEQMGRMLTLRMKSPYTLDPKDDDHLEARPGPSSHIIAASQSAALEKGTCAQPFTDSTVKSQAQPRWPNSVMRPADRISTAVEVAIDSDGVLSDAWVWGPSGFPVFDDEALRTAKASIYTSATAYCKAVPGFYFFRVTFDPN